MSQVWQRRLSWRGAEGGRQKVAVLFCTILSLFFLSFLLLFSLLSLEVRNDEPIYGLPYCRRGTVCVSVYYFAFFSQKNKGKKTLKYKNTKKWSDCSNVLSTMSIYSNLTMHSIEGMYTGDGAIITYLLPPYYNLNKRCNIKLYITQ